MPGYKNSNYNACLLEDVRLTGHIIPHSWYEHIRLPNGKPDLNAIILLSEIVYWFRPFREERELKQKFAGETLHLSYKQIEDRFGLSRKQAREALHRLEAADLITIEERGKPAPENSWRKCIFIDLNAPAILEMERLRVLEETDRAPEDT